MNKVKVLKGQYGYSIGVSSKKQDGEWLNDYFPAQFKKDVSMESKTEIEIKEFQISPYESKDGIKYKICIWDFDYVNSEPVKEEEPKAEEPVKDPFADFANECPINDDDLPF